MEFLKIKYLYKNANKREIKDSKKITLRNFPCGDTINLYLVTKNGIIDDVSFNGNSCMLCTSSACVMCKNVVSKDINDVLFMMRDLKNILIGKSKSNVYCDLNIFFRIFNSRRTECVILPWKALIDII